MPAFICNVKRQSYSNWTLAVVHDGPDDDEVAQTVRRIADGDGRINYFKTPLHHGNLGIGPRLFGMQKLARMAPAIKYFLHWDDDNEFYSDALSNIEIALEQFSEPDVLLVPFKHKGRYLPSKNIAPQAIPMGGIDTANLCVKAAIAIHHYGNVQNLSDSYHQDFYYYRSICDDNSTRVCLADIPHIGLYDGLRFWEILRWTICPRPLKIYHTAPMRFLRRILPRG